MINFDRIKLALFDFDDTLAVHTEHGWNKGIAKRQLVAAAAGKLYEASTLRVSYDLKTFVALCKEHDVELGLISASGFAPRVEQKMKWVEEHYGVRMQNYCVGSVAEKPDAIEAIRQAKRFCSDEILLVDDYYKVLSDVTKVGIQVVSPAEVSIFLRDNGYV